MKETEQSQMGRRVLRLPMSHKKDASLIWVNFIICLAYKLSTCIFSENHNKPTLWVLWYAVLTSTYNLFKKNNMSLVVRKPDFCICENKDTE